MAILYIEQWLMGCVDFHTPESAIRTILFNRNVEPGSKVSDTSEKQRDLCLADLLMYVADSSTSSNGEYVSDNGWIHQTTKKYSLDKDALRARALALYRKWGIEVPDTRVKITMKNLY